MILQLYPLTCSITFIHGHHGHHISVIHTPSVTFNENKEQIHKSLGFHLKSEQLKLQKNMKNTCMDQQYVTTHQASDISEAQTDRAPR